MTEFQLIPHPAQITLHSGTCRLASHGQIVVASPAALFTAQQLQSALMQILPSAQWAIVSLHQTAEIVIYLRYASLATPQGYEIHIQPDSIVISGDAAGLFYGVCTLRQLLITHKSALPCMTISDAPALAVRGIMLDISRDKVPTLDTLYALVDCLAQLKINQLQLYTEHTFAYQQHRAVWEHAAPLTAQDILELDVYCQQRYIDLVPNQNSLGHMEHWLAVYPYLAECPQGFQAAWGAWSAPTTLNPTHPESAPLMQALYAELLPNFTSGLFNVGCDEPWELGQCRNKTADKATLYLDWVQQLHTTVTSHGKRMLLWADIINHYPQRIADLPPDIIALEWGYEATHDFENPCARFADAGIEFYVCPGTSSWNALVGRHHNMLHNVDAAVAAAVTHGASGLLMTDWGDNGHWQPLPVSYAGFAYAAAQSWQPGSITQDALPALLDLFVFRDTAGIVGGVCEQLGNLYRLTECDPINGQLAAYALHWSAGEMSDKLTYYYEDIAGIPMRLTRAQLDEMIETIDAALTTLSQHAMQRDDAALIADELTQSARLLQHGARWLRYCQFGEAGEDDVLRLHRDHTRFIPQQRELWLARNRRGGLENSLRPLYRLRAAYEERLSLDRAR